MSSSFVHAPRVETGGSAVDVWLRTNWDAAVFTGSDLIATHDLGGVSHSAKALPPLGAAHPMGDGSRHPVKDCAVVFRNFRPAGGAYFADPVAVVQYRSAMLTSIEGPAKYEHPVVHKDDVLVPLGTPAWGNAQTRIVLQQSARQWVSGGRNTADMSDEHVITMYYAALQQLVFAAGNATRAADQQRWFPALVALTQAFSAVHAHYEGARKVTAALVLTPGVNDMLQKGLAYVFHSDQEWSAEARLDMLAIAIRRNLRHGTMMVGMAPGPFALFVLVPLLRSVAHPEAGVLTESAALLERFNAAASELLHAFVEDAAAPTTDREGWTTVARGHASRAEAFKVRVLVSLSTAMGTPLTTEQVRGLLDHISRTDASSDPDWVALGVLPAKPVFAAGVLADRFSVGSRGSTYRVKVVPTATDALNVYSYKGVEWAAIGFKTPGIYTVHAHDLGIATRATGDTRGQELTANWRLTAGADILPATRPGYSLAGAEHKRLPSGRWDYTRSAPLSLEEPFKVLVEPTRVRLEQSGRLFFTLEKGGKEPALLAFKNLWLSVHYAPPPPPTAPLAPRTPTPVSSGRSWASMAAAPPSRGVHDLPPTALLAKLRELVATAE